MKCLSECGYSELPNNAVILRRHMEVCSNDGPLKNVESPDVVWRDGEFVVVRQAEEDEQTYNDVVQFVKPAQPTLPEVEIVEVLEEEPVEE